jgi:hypothetical protein
MSDEIVYVGEKNDRDNEPSMGYLKSLDSSPQQNQWGSPCQTIWASPEDTARFTSPPPLYPNPPIGGTGGVVGMMVSPELQAQSAMIKEMHEAEIRKELEALERERQESLKKDVKGVKCVSAAVIFSNRPHEEGGDVNSSALTVKIRKDRYHNWGLEQGEPVYTLTVENSLESDDHQHHHQQLVCVKITHSEKEDIIRMLSSI